MYKCFTQNETRKWIDMLDDFVTRNNNTYHSTIKMSPLEVNKPENVEIVWWNIHGAYVTAEHGLLKFKTGETVRVSKCKVF